MGTRTIRSASAPTLFGPMNMIYPAIFAEDALYLCRGGESKKSPPDRICLVPQLLIKKIAMKNVNGEVRLSLYGRTNHIGATIKGFQISEM